MHYTERNRKKEKCDKEKNRRKDGQTKQKETRTKEMITRNTEAGVFVGGRGRRTPRKVNLKKKTRENVVGDIKFKKINQNHRNAVFFNTWVKIDEIQLNTALFNFTSLAHLAAAPPTPHTHTHTPTPSLDTPQDRNFLLLSLQ